MKKIIAVLAFALIINFTYSQIIHESTYGFSGAYTRLANSGYKFFLMDVGTNQCRIYNTDHTLWKTINLSVPPDQFLYDIKFVSENLFTTDNTLCLAYIYYNYKFSGEYYVFTAKVIKEDGTELIEIPRCQYLYINSIADEGTKLVAYAYDYAAVPNTIQTIIYDLPGQINIMPGDANCDGTVNLLDIVNTVNFIMGQNPVPFCNDNADVNEDGFVNIIDVVMIVNIIMNNNFNTQSDTNN